MVNETVVSGVKENITTTGSNFAQSEGGDALITYGARSLKNIGDLVFALGKMIYPQDPRIPIIVITVLLVGYFWRKVRENTWVFWIVLFFVIWVMMGGI